MRVLNEEETVMNSIKGDKMNKEINEIIKLQKSLMVV